MAEATAALIYNIEVGIDSIPPSRYNKNMNDKLKRKIRELNISAYRLSKDTGISYTTINELLNEKISINNVSAEKVYKLSLYLDCDISDILNDFSKYDRLEGKYNGYSYRWEQKKNCIKVYVCDHNSTIKEEKMKSINTEHPYKFAKLYAEALIDNLEKEKTKEMIYEKLHLNAQRR